MKTLRELDLSGNCVSHELVTQMTLVKSLQFTSISFKSLISPDRFDFLKSLPLIGTRLSPRKAGEAGSQPLKIMISHFQVDQPKIGTERLT